MENDLKMSEKWTKNANCERPYYGNKSRNSEKERKKCITAKGNTK